MKYYAVTEDPNELLHYGVKGMKWGQHLFGDDLRPKSSGYKRALGKLRKSASKKATSVKSAVKKSSTQRAMNRQQRQQDKYNRAMQKAQRRIELIENLRTVDQARVYERGIDRQYHREVRAAKNQNKLNRMLDKQANRYERNERKMDKYLQQARQGKLKYGKLSDDQVQRITQRLNAERNARQLGSAEKTWRQQKKEAFRKGKLSGIERGTAAAMEEVARAGTIYGIQNFMNRRKRNALAKQQGKETRIKNKEQNKKTHKDIREEVKQEAYESEIRSGKGWLERSTNPFVTTSGAAKRLQENKAAERERQRIQNVQDRLADARDEKFEKKYIDDYGFRTESEAVNAHKNFLEAKVTTAEHKYGKGSDQHREAKAALKDFNKAGKDEKRRSMLKTDTDQEKVKEATKKAEALELFSKIKEIQAQNKQIDQAYSAKIKAYEQDLKNWSNQKSSTRGPRPKPPATIKYKPTPDIPVEMYDLFTEMKLNPFANSGGGNRK